MAQRARQIRYYKECVIPAFPGDPKTAPPSYRYFIDIVDRLHKIKAEDLTENSVLLGSPARITAECGGSNRSPTRNPSTSQTDTSEATEGETSSRSSRLTKPFVSPADWATWSRVRRRRLRATRIDERAMN